MSLAASSAECGEWDGRQPVTPPSHFLGRVGHQITGGLGLLGSCSLLFPVGWLLWGERSAHCVT